MGKRPQRKNRKRKTETKYKSLALLKQNKKAREDNTKTIKQEAGKEKNT